MSKDKRKTCLTASSLSPYMKKAMELVPMDRRGIDVVATLLQRIDELEAKVKELEAENARLVASIKPSEYYSVLGSEFIRFLKWGEGEDNGK